MSRLPTGYIINIIIFNLTLKIHKSHLHNINIDCKHDGAENMCIIIQEPTDQTVNINFRNIYNINMIIRYVCLFLVVRLFLILHPVHIRPNIKSGLKSLANIAEHIFLSKTIRFLHRLTTVHLEYVKRFDLIFTV